MIQSAKATGGENIDPSRESGAGFTCSHKQTEQLWQNLFYHLHNVATACFICVWSLSVSPTSEFPTNFFYIILNYYLKIVKVTRIKKLFCTTDFVTGISASHEG